MKDLKKDTKNVEIAIIIADINTDIVMHARTAIGLDGIAVSWLERSQASLEESLSIQQIKRVAFLHFKWAERPEGLKTTRYI